MEKIIAREWLIFLGCLIAGFVIVAPTIALFSSETYAQFWRALSMQEERLYFWRAIFILFSPYLAIQLVRSIIWAISARKELN